MRKSRFSEEQIIGILKRVERGQALGRRLPRDGHQRRDLLSLESPIWRPRGQPTPAVASVGRRESAAQAGGRRLDAGQSGAEGHYRKKLVTPTARRRAVGYLQATYRVLRATRLSADPGASDDHAVSDSGDVPTRRRCASGCAPWRACGRAGGIAACTCCCSASTGNGERSIGNGSTGSIAWRAWPCVGANASGWRSRHVGSECARWTRGQAWAMDFMQDTLADGRRFRTLNVLDTVTRECLAIEVDTSLPGQRVVRVLDQLVDQLRRAPADHGG